MGGLWFGDRESGPARIRDHQAGALARRWKKLELSLASSGVTGLWILRADGTTRLTAAAPGETAVPFLLDPAETTALIAETPSPRFFAERGAETWEVCIRRLGGNGTEWLAVGRRWDEDRLGPA